MKTNKTIKLMLHVLALACMTLWAVNVQAQSQATVTADATAHISAGIELAQVEGADLRFGHVVRSSTAGTVLYDPSTNVRTPAGGVTLNAADAGGVAVFDVEGEKNYGYHVTVPTTPITITLVGGSATMTVTAFTTNLVSNNGSIPSSGKTQFKVGGTLNVGVDQAEGDYTGPFDVIVAYL